MASVLAFAFSCAAAQEARELPPNTIDCTAFTKARDGDWRVGAPTTFDIGAAKGITLRGVTVRPGSDLLGRGVSRSWKVNAPDGLNGGQAVSPSQRISASRGGAFDLTAHGRDLARPEHPASDKTATLNGPLTIGKRPTLQSLQSRQKSKARRIAGEIADISCQWGQQATSQTSGYLLSLPSLRFYPDFAIRGVVIK